MIQKEKGILIVFSGFSGSGKGTIMKHLMSRYEDKYALSISATTRTAREGEEDGREYFFHTVGEFEDMIEKNQLIEYAQYVGNYYGTPKKYVQEQLDQGKDVILEIEIQGALKVRHQFPDTLLMFVTPPSPEILKQRLIHRGTESIDVIEKRMKRAIEEASGIEEYDYLVINDNLECCVEEVNSIIVNEHKRVSRNQEFIKSMKQELNDFLKGDN